MIVFQQLAPSKTKDESLRGGIVVVQTNPIVQQLGGDGATFRVTLPTEHHQRSGS